VYRKNQFNSEPRNAIETGVRAGKNENSVARFRRINHDG